jgi:two-component system, NtrC family, nitrogen regulation sensor histidine kinase NtrY
MIYKSFTLAIVTRLLILILLTACFCFVLFQDNWIIGVLLFIPILISVWNLLYFMNATNRKVAFFFDAVSNDDTTLHFPTNLRSKSLNTLHQSINQLNKHISNIKIKNEHNERFFREMMKYSTTGLMAIDDRGYIELINNSALDLIGFPHISHIHLLKQKNSFLFDQLMQLQPGQSRTVKILQGTDLRLLLLKVAPLNFGEKKYRLYSLDDIKAQLEENELDSWQKLIRVMTHEIMNSIAPITSLSNTLTHIFLKNGEPLPLDEVTQKHISNTIHGLDVIENTGKGLMHFVEDYRRLTKIPKPVFKPIKINNWLQSIEILMKSKMEEENIEFKISGKEYHKELIGDEKLLNQVIINILNNAMDALKDTKKKKISLNILEGQLGKLKIMIADNGTGIAPDEIEKIFIPFYTTKENGSGIGLSLCRQIMRLHKGSISVLSATGEKNTYFILSF